jgi:hypothetical protein
MATFVKIINNKVINVIVADQAHIDTLSDKEFYMEDDGTKFNAAAKGATYDPLRDAFISKKPYPSWVLNETTCRWEAPVAFPADGSREKDYRWNESTTSWDETI